MDAASDASAPDTGGDARAETPPIDAPAPHVGGWRMAGVDATASHRTSAVGPPAIATGRLFHEEPDRMLSAPIIDEDGSLYFTSRLSVRTFDLVSLSRTGAERWRTFLPGGSFLSDLTLGPRGDLVAISRVGDFPDSVVRLITFDAATGEAHPGAVLATSFTTSMRVGPDGRVLVRRFVLDDPRTLSLEMHPSPEAPARWTRASGAGAFAIAPGEATVVSVEAGEDNAPPFTVVSIDAATGAERWRRALPQQLTQGPGLAIDRDGAAYVAVSTNGTGEMHVFKFSPAGEVLWETEELEQFPVRVVLGADTVHVAAQFSVTLRKSDGALPAGGANPCGLPLATDGADRLYSACDSGIRVTDPLGQVLAEWRGSPQAIAIAPDGSVFYWPSSTTRYSQLFRIQ